MLSYNYIYTYKGDNWNKKAHDYFWPKSVSNVYVKHGLFYESSARKKYENITGHLVEQTGLVISNLNPWLAYSPDGIVMDGDQPNTLLQIKCPYAGKYQSIIYNLIFITYIYFCRKERNHKNVVVNCKYLENKNGKLSQKKKHTYYAQIQFGMALLNFKKM